MAFSEKLKSIPISFEFHIFEFFNIFWPLCNEVILQKFIDQKVKKKWAWIREILGG